MRLSIASLRFTIAAGISFACFLIYSYIIGDILNIDEKLIYIMATFLVMITNFLTLRLFVFPNQNVNWTQQFFAFLTSNLSFRLIEYLCYLAMISLGFNYLVSTFIVLSGAFIIKFFFYKNVIFKHQTVKNREEKDYHEDLRKGA